MNVNTFKKCDLHIHSSSCFSRRFDENSFLEHLLKSDLEVIAITDHNSVDVGLLEKLHSKIQSTDKSIFAGVEVNVKLKQNTIERYELTLGKGSKGDYFHGIIWCSYEDRSSLRDIVDSLFCKEGSITQNDIDDANSGLTSRKSLSRKTDGHAIYLEDLQDELRIIPHFFVFHENKGDRNLSDYLPNSDENRKPLTNNLKYKDSLFYYSQALAVEGGDDSNRYISAGIRDELNHTLAALFFSDAQQLDEIGSKFTWIDFDGDLESLLLAISDPESRIATSDVQKDNPQDNRFHYLESIQFETISPNGTKSSHSIKFSPGLNGVVGSRGSGKSLLAHAIAHKELDSYNELIATDSIKYKVSGSHPRQTPPKYLYLKQGELEEIYKSGEYSAIPFIREQLNEIKGNAQQSLSAASSSIKSLLEYERNAIDAFLQKYTAGYCTMDILDDDPPSGYLVNFPNYTPLSDSATTKKLAQDLEKTLDIASELVSAINKLEARTDIPESSALFEVIRNRISSIQATANSLHADLEAFTEKIAEIDLNWFVLREQLIETFAQEQTKINREQDSAHLDTYKTNMDELSCYFEDLLKLRLHVNSIDYQTTAMQVIMREPIDPVNESIEGEPIVVEIKSSGFKLLNSALSALTTSSYSEQEKLVAQICILSSEPEQVHRLFNGNRIRTIRNAKTSDYVSKYLAALANDLTANWTLEETVYLNGKNLREMSPGMRAEALLKLFLNDRIIKSENLLIILDQPEDNLDTDTISKFLIPRLKRLKTSIQLIVISHSAPIIINGDARSIILCNANGGEIEYSVGTINGREIKEDVSNVLDGGERYLKMRLNKYNFQLGDQHDNH